MSCNIAVSIKNVNKCFRVYEKPQHRLYQAILKNKKYYKEFWACRNISFDVIKGETIGIVGSNGSGKSTLLQMICGTLTPTSGSINVNGRIAALLELGSGFNPEFTGHENIYLNGSILGLSNAEIKEKYNDIVKFSDIGEFIHQPIKSYSSGMVVRLAFAIAINVEPDVLIVDEALSVGDELFQRKCFSKIEMLKKKGVTILFVSHSSQQILELCDRAVLINKADLLLVGKPKLVISSYQRLLSAKDEDKGKIISSITDNYSCITEGITPSTVQESDMPPVTKADDKPLKLVNEYYDPNLVPQSTTSYSSKGANIIDAYIIDGDGRKVNQLISSKEYTYTYIVRFDADCYDVRFGMMIKFMNGIELGGAVLPSSESAISIVNQNEVKKIEFKFKPNFNQGIYFLNAGVFSNINGAEDFNHRVLDIAMFRIVTEEKSNNSGFVDICPRLKILAHD